MVNVLTGLQHQRSILDLRYRVYLYYKLQTQGLLVLQVTDTGSTFITRYRHRVYLHY